MKTIDVRGIEAEPQKRAVAFDPETVGVLARSATPSDSRISATLERSVLSRAESSQAAG